MRIFKGGCACKHNVLLRMFKFFSSIFDHPLGSPLQILYQSRMEKENHASSLSKSTSLIIYIMNTTCYFLLLHSFLMEHSMLMYIAVNIRNVAIIEVYDI